MKIIVLGAGQVGSTVARSLAGEDNDITVVDTDSKVLQDLSNSLDIRTVQGVASYPSVLRKAGAEDTDMIIAATDSDETNIVAMQVAYSMYRTPQKIARVRAQEYTSWTELFNNDHIPIDVLISPERLVTDHIERMIEHPGAIQVVDFANGKVRLVGVEVRAGAPMDNMPLSHLAELLDDVDTRVVAVFRTQWVETREGGQQKHEDFISADGATVLLPEDIVYYLGERRHARQIMAVFHHDSERVERVMIAGGGNIGFQLARQLERRFKVKIIEANQERSEIIAAELNSAMVFTGDAASHELLLEESIDEMDVFCALTNDDEANILSAMLAKRNGARKIMSLINRPAYVDLVERDIIDVAISPQQITIGALLTHIRRGDVAAVHSLRRGASEALEGVAHGDSSNSPLVGKAISEIELPSSAAIGTVVRGDQVLMAHHDIVIEDQDHLIVLLSDKRQIGEVEKLFQVGFTFI